MKFLAMLKDSLREAIDAKVFYVMVGLSVIVIFLAATLTFTPTAGGETVMRAAALPLSLDIANLETAMQDDNNSRLIDRLSKEVKDVFQVTEVAPIDGSADTPSGTFSVRLKIVSFKGFFGGSSVTGDAIERIRDKFGRLGDWTIVDVLDVKPVDKKSSGLLQSILNGGAEFEVTARPTPTALRLWPHSVSLFFGALPLFNQEKGFPLGAQLYFIEQLVVNGIGAWITILVSVVITAFFIPNMLRKGTIDLLIVKPINRPLLLLYKYIGGLLFIALNTAVAVVGIWVAFGMRSGIWAPGFLASIPVITFFFAILYSASTFFGVLTRSPVAAILLTCGVWFFLFIVGVTHSVFNVMRDGDRLLEPKRSAMSASVIGLSADAAGAGPLLAVAALPPEVARVLVAYRFYDSPFARVVAGLHYVLPRTSDLDSLNTQLSFRELVFPVNVFPGGKQADKISWAASLTVSGAFIAMMLGLSCWRFATRDY